MFVHRLETGPAALDLALEFFDHVGVLGAGEVTGLAHHLQPLDSRYALLPILGVVRDVGYPLLHFVEREEAAVHGLLEYLLALGLDAAPVQRAGNEELAV